MGALEQYWAGIGGWPQIQAESFSALISHNGERGRSNELVVADFMIKLLPPGLAIGSGVILGADGVQSRQCDLIIYEAHKHPALFSQTTQFMHPADTAVMTVEVKTTLDKTEVVKIGKNSKSVRSAVRADNGRPAPFVVIFAFSTSASPATTARWFTELPADELPDLVLVIDPGILIELRDGLIVAQCVLLHEIDGDGNRLRNTWIEWPDSGATAQVRDHVYPVAKVRLTDGNNVRVFEPGRALLLFSVKLLSSLSERNQLRSAWWEAYLDATTSDVVTLD